MTFLQSVAFFSTTFCWFVVIFPTTFGCSTAFLYCSLEVDTELILRTEGFFTKVLYKALNTVKKTGKETKEDNRKI